MKLRNLFKYTDGNFIIVASENSYDLHCVAYYVFGDSHAKLIWEAIQENPETFQLNSVGSLRLTEDLSHTTRLTRIVRRACRYLEARAAAKSIRGAYGY